VECNPFKPTGVGDAKYVSGEVGEMVEVLDKINIRFLLAYIIRKVIGSG
jgi:hypothetical protein